MRNPLSKFVRCVKLNYLGLGRDVHCIEKTKVSARKSLLMYVDRLCSFSSLTCCDNVDISTGLIFRKADNLSNLSLACCSTAITKAS